MPPLESVHLIDTSGDELRVGHLLKGGADLLLLGQDIPVFLQQALLLRSQPAFSPGGAFFLFFLGTLHIVTSFK